MNAKITLAAVLSCSLLTATVAQAGNHTFSVGYAQSKVQDFKNLDGVILQYQYEWDSPLSVIGTLSYQQAKETRSYYDAWNDYYRNNLDVTYYSLLAGPAWRFNDYLSIYGLVGLAHTKAKGTLEWRNSVHADEPGGSSYNHISKTSTNLAYAVGVTINPVKNVSLSLGYEGSNADIEGSHTINGFNVGVGYRF